MPYDDYDVDRVAEDKARQARYDAERYTNERVDGLRLDMDAGLNELRNELNALERVLNSRTEHLA